MTAALKHGRGALEAFDPSTGEIHPARSTGLRREIGKVEAMPLRWPSGPKERFELFDAWHDVAMQIVDREKCSFRLMAIAKKVIIWASGTIIGDNAELAMRAGCCSEKTISRDVKAYSDLGILESTLAWKRPGGGKFITVRTLRPSLPLILPEWVILPESSLVSLDTSGPDLEAVSLDTSGPGGLDTSGPATLDHKKGGADAA